MISPELRQSFLLSSSTVFMFSIQMASTGPSKTIHLLSPASARLLVVLRAWRMSTEPMPSVHSCVCRSNSPYSWPIVIDFGLRMYAMTFSKLRCRRP